MRMGREERPAPAHFPRRDALPPAVVQLALRGEVVRVARGVDPRERAGVRLRPDRGDRVELLDLFPLLRRDVLDLLARAVFEEQLERALEPQARVWKGAGADRGAVELEHERGRRVERVDPEDLARLKLERVVDDEVGEPGDAWIGHACLIPD